MKKTFRNQYSFIAFVCIDDNQKMKGQHLDGQIENFELFSFFK